jgi:hypothetical protein
LHPHEAHFASGQYPAGSPGASLPASGWDDTGEIRPRAPSHFSELNLVAIRRVYHGLLDTGMELAGPRNCG